MSAGEEGRWARRVALLDRRHQIARLALAGELDFLASAGAPFSPVDAREEHASGRLRAALGYLRMAEESIRWGRSNAIVRSHVNGAVALLTKMAAMDLADGPAHPAEKPSVAVDAGIAVDTYRDGPMAIVLGPLVRLGLVPELHQLDAARAMVRLATDGHPPTEQYRRAQEMVPAVMAILGIRPDANPRRADERWADQIRCKRAIEEALLEHPWTTNWARAAGLDEIHPNVSHPGPPEQEQPE